MSQPESDIADDVRDRTRVHDDDLEAENEPSGESMYNNGKGIAVSVTFTPLLPPPATGEKHRKNAKSQPINRAFFIHEDSTLRNLLDITFEQYDISDKMMYGIGNRSGILTAMNFTITYMILHTNYKNIVLGNLSDFTTIIEEVKEHRSPAFKLIIVETKYNDGEETEDDEDTEGEPAGKKAATGPTDEEMEQNEAIANLTRQYTSPPEAKHVNLTPLHLNTWAAAMVGPNKQAGVDLDNPPNTKIFDITYTDPTDIAMLSRHCLNAVTQTQSSAPSIVINNNFKDIVGLLNGDRGPDPAIKNPPQLLRQQPVALQPKLTAGIPCVPGYHGVNQDADLLFTEAGNIGYPVLIKTIHGGGGKGMRVVSSPSQFKDALASAQRESLKSFGDADVLVVKYIERPRHVEVQVFVDTLENTVNTTKTFAQLSKVPQPS
ncbi:carbamoyl-phosphate synthase L chain, ATP binding domain-containing protein [Suillus clintonianus]|uniref:carbamoyl-phosphate synthase L chain, ATP binding domain-containing protein n=1 Tax=Suillus clintonianus TaxID=1904413 RepID=UPI001B86EC11|nr:carbamoyl-phosphate synthase L chain, ATP binding domain-containing protein [Suillus clintonianus]KAG2132756.1 carbamoyl-phosphate synthase L chain, ATP binding domain-containing protein [Suillus clintonianus]